MRWKDCDGIVSASNESVRTDSACLGHLPLKPRLKGGRNNEGEIYIP